MSSQTQTDLVRLLSAARRGHRDSLGQLLDLYVNYLKLMARTQLDKKLLARTSPSDVVQETLLEAHRDFDGFRGETPEEFLAWLRRILVHNIGHLVQRHVLAAKRDIRREVSLEDVGQTLERSTSRLAAVLADVGPTPSDNALQHEAGLVLADELEALSDEYREVIVLRHLEGLSFAEVGERMKRTAGAARMLWMRAIASLRTRFEARGVM